MMMRVVCWLWGRVVWWWCECELSHRLETFLQPKTKTGFRNSHR